MSGPSQSRSRRMATAIAWAALILSFPVWGFVFVAPFLPLDVGQRAMIATTSIVAGEALFWGAGLVLGADVVARFRAPKVTTGQSFLGRRVAVIGATGGLGEAVARAVAREGGALVLIARDAPKLEPLASALGAEAIVSDLSPAALRAAAEACGALDHVVCATGVDVRRPLDQHADDDVATQLDVALAGPVHVARTFLDRLREGGTLAVFGGFGDGSLALPYYSVDVAARAGLAGFCAAANQELALEGRAERLCYVCPAPADTAAERPFAALWAHLGSPLVPPERVANFVLTALLARRTVAIMGPSNRALVRARALAPGLVDRLVLWRAGAPLKEAFGR